MSQVFFMRIPLDIINSSIWLEPPEICKVWVTLLAMKGPDHVVRKGIHMIADRVHLPDEVVERALKKLMAPDPHSSNRAHDGRRVEELPGGGYRLLNGDLYDRLMRKEYNREAQADSRKRKKGKGPGSCEQIACRAVANGEPLEDYMR